MRILGAPASTQNIVRRAKQHFLSLKKKFEETPFAYHPFPPIKNQEAHVLTL